MINYILIKLLQRKIKELDSKTEVTAKERKIRLTYNEFVMYDEVRKICVNLIKFLKSQNKIKK